MNDDEFFRRLDRHLPETYEAAGIPSSRRSQWDAALQTLRPIDRPISAREFERFNVDPDHAKAMMDAGIAFDDCIAAGCLRISLADYHDFAARGIRDPVLIALLLGENKLAPDQATAIQYPRALLAHYAKLWPGIWAIFERSPDNVADRYSMFLASCCINDIVDDPVFANEILNRPTEDGRLPLNHAAAMPMELLTLWRLTQGVYRFDKALFDELLDTDVPQDFPVEPLRYLPEPIVYIPLIYDAPLAFGDTSAIGAWIGAPHMDRGPFMYVHTLRGGSMYAFPDANTLDLKLVEDRVPHDIIGRLRSLASLALYLSSPDADMTGTPRTVTSSKTRRGLRYFPPDKQQEWDVGVRIGAALRSAAMSSGNVAVEGTRGPVRPHIRRAHWHRFWHGQRSGERLLRAKWLPPIAINVENVDSLPAVVRDVLAD